jgi:hypothetical protein
VGRGLFYNFNGGMGWWWVSTSSKTTTILGGYSYDTESFLTELNI